MDINYLDKISSQLSRYNDIELIESKYWDIIYNNLYLTHELLKLRTFKLFSKLNTKFFSEDIICLDLLEYDVPAYNYIPTNILNNNSFWIHALEKNYLNISKIPEEILINNQDLSFWICEKFSEQVVFQYFPDSLKNNFDLAYFGVDNNSKNFYFLSENLKNSIYIYEIIYKKNSKNNKSSDFFKLAGSEIRSNYKFAKKSIIENPSTFSFVDDYIKNDASFFIEILNYSDNILKYANNNIKKNEFCVIASIEKNPLSIEFADKKFKSSIDFLLSIKPYLIKFNNFNEFAKLLDISVFSNYLFVEQYFTLISDNSSHYLLGDNIKNDYTIMKKFCAFDINSYKFASLELKKNISFIRDCYDIHNDNKLESFNLNSIQSSIFSMIEDNHLNDIIFLQDLYKEFKPIFKDVVFPIIQNKKTVLTELLSNEINIEKGLKHLLDKFELKDKLETNLHLQNYKNKNIKI